MRSYFRRSLYIRVARRFGKDEDEIRVKLKNVMRSEVNERREGERKTYTSLESPSGRSRLSLLRSIVLLDVK